jgi:two-component system chemotaxis sensor kinase CheA
MDVVKTEIEALGGAVSIATRHGEGASFTIRLPLTVAAMPSLVLTLGAKRFALARAAVVEQAPFGPQTDYRVERVGGAALMRWREHLLPALDLPFALGAVAPNARTRGHALMIEAAGARFVALMEHAPHAERLVLRPEGALDTTGSTVSLIDPQRLAGMLGLLGAPERNQAPAWRASAAF